MQDEFCVLNIGPKQRRKRLNFGLAMLAIGSAQAAGLLISGWSRWTRLSLFFTFMLSGYGIFQAKEKTWVRLAARGVRDLDNGEETVEDNAVAEVLKKQANKVKLEALGMGLGLTALALLLPAKTKK